ncbi:chaperone modulator CbpM [Caenimonas terrae]|uniref:Chaperone modulator CbpM n=1 Tax=Caenimonas terrae TaxID=696074 RepID=A0ABW0NIE8_9BURK
MATQAGERGELAWLDGRETITVTELSRVCALSAADLEELVGYGALEPLRAPLPETLFSAEWVMPLRQVARLRRDLDLDLYAVSILLGLIQRIEGLEGELRSLRARSAG